MTRAMTEGDRNRRVVVTGIGLTSPLGDSPAALHAALCRGDSGLAPVELFSTDGLPCHLAGEIRGFDPAPCLGKKNFRPLDRTARLSAVAAHLALAASGLGGAEGEELTVGLVLGTTFGSIHTISEFDRRGLTAGPNYVKPLDFANSVINAPAGQTAIWHRLAGVNSTITGGPTAGLQALAYGADLIRAGGVEAVLAGGAEELCFESYFGFARARLLAGSNGAGPEGEVPIPFHPRRNGFALAEGAAFLALESAQAARARGARVLAAVAGHGSACDPSRGEDPRQAEAALARAVRLALAEGGLTPEDLDVWMSGASGSPHRDAREARGMAAVLGERLGSLPTTAVKAQLGESLGASGAFQAAALLEAMRGGILPGIPGLPAPDPELPALDVASEARPLLATSRGICRGLATAVGLDGNHAALILETWQEM